MPFLWANCCYDYRMNKFLRYFKEHRNKILAVTFSALALAVYLGYYVVLEIEFQGFYFRTLIAKTNDWIFVFWNIFFYIVLVFGGLLVRNINNDGNAYHNILIFVFAIAFDALYSLVFGSYDIVNTAVNSDALGIIVLLLFLAFVVAELIFGVLLYINFGRYMRGVGVEWSKIRRLAIIFSILVCLGAAPMVVLSFMAGEGLISLLSVSVAEAFCSVAIIFTLERLRRY